jgi:hypothetical protein
MSQTMPPREIVAARGKSSFFSFEPSSLHQPIRLCVSFYKHAASIRRDDASPGKLF